MTHGTEALPVDRWNKEREAYTDTYAENQGYGGPRRGYGVQDLNYYGDYFYAPGYGYAWQPYGFANSMIGWSPYSNGAWIFFPGFGYTLGLGLSVGMAARFTMAHGRLWEAVSAGHGCPAAILPSGMRNNFQTMPVISKPPGGRQPLSAPAAPVAGPGANHSGREGRRISCLYSRRTDST